MGVGRGRRLVKGVSIIEANAVAIMCNNWQVRNWVFNGTDGKALA